VKFKVQATKEGFYNQYVHVVGEVFELLMNEDGTMPLKMKQVKVSDVFPTSHPQAGKDTFHWDDSDEPELDAEGNPIHRDFAPDGEELKATAPGFKGDIFSPGWMRRVPDHIACGIYPADQLFSVMGKEERRAPISRVVLDSSQPVNAPRATQIVGKIDRTRRQLPAE
jgi:hypothetical protein